MESNKKESRGDIQTRRTFMKTAGAAATAGTLVLAGFDCRNLSSRMKYVTLGRTGIRVSQFLGDRMTDRRMYELAITAGVNYWHKFGHWDDPAPYDLFRSLDRDSFYCDTTVASLERDRAIEIFERILEKTGLAYIDGFKIHSQYTNAEDIKNKTGAVEAFELLKKQGKTRYLMMSQHTNVSEVFEAAVESDMFDLIQVPVNPIVPRDYLTREVFEQKFSQDEYLAQIKKASDRGIAITAMKVFLWGKKYWEEVPDLKDRVKDYLPDDSHIATALIHWTLAVPGVKAFGNMLSSFEELSENLEAVGGSLTAREDEGLKRFAGCIGGCTCRLCGACEQANPGGVAVPDILRYAGYAKENSRRNMARALYAALPVTARVKPGDDLKRYEQSCPYGLPVADLLIKAHCKLT